jgi:hypothetical protein
MPYLGLIGVENLRAGPLPLSASGHYSCSSMYLSRRCPSLRFGISWYGGKRRTKRSATGFSASTRFTVLRAGRRPKRT